jgi:hypothetical protein
VIERRLCGPLRISASSAVKVYVNAEKRRDTQRAAEKSLDPEVP